MGDFIEDVGKVIDFAKEAKSTFDDYYGFYTGELSKLTIRGYSDNSATKEVQGSPFELMINPNKITRDITVETGQEKPLGSKDCAARFVNTAPGSISFDFVLDGTGIVNNRGVLKGFTKQSVDKQIDIFLGIVHLSHDNKQQDKHPRFVRINYGSFDWTCTLNSLSINYTLFNNSGKALRATLTCKFDIYIRPKTSPKLPKVASSILDNFEKGEDGMRPIGKKIDKFFKDALDSNLDFFR